MARIIMRRLTSFLFFHFPLHLSLHAAASGSVSVMRKRNNGCRAADCDRIINIVWSRWLYLILWDGGAMLYNVGVQTGRYEIGVTMSVIA